MKNLVLLLSALAVPALLGLAFMGCGDDAKPGCNPSQETCSDVDAADDTENPGECTGPTSEAIADSASDGSTPDCPSCEGADIPSFTLEDVQPLSCGYGESYGLDVFEGQTLLVTLLSAGCSFCQQQVGYLEQMQIELSLEGHDVEMVAINLDSQAERSEMLTDRCSFPVLQDTESDDVWGMYQGRKDDIYIYGADGTLHSFFRSGEELSLILSTEEGYANVRDALRDAASDN